MCQLPSGSEPPVRWVRFVAVLLLGIVAAPAAAQRTIQLADPTQTYGPSLVPDRITLTLTANPTTSMAVTWRTATSVEEAWGEWTPAIAAPTLTADAHRVPAETQQLVADLGPANYHSVVFDGLQPGTKYAYRVGDGTNWSAWNQFRTAAAEPAPFSFVYFGDAQNDIKSLWSRVIRQAFRDAPHAAFLLHAGDLVNRGTSDAEWGAWHEAAGWVNATVPIVAVAGNHEYGRGFDLQSRLTPHWRAQFALPQNGPEGLEESVYYLDYQGVRIVVLNSNERLADQAQWLDGVLQKGGYRWSIVSAHHPVFSSAAGRDNPQVRAAWQPILDRHHVDLVLQGHDHTYARSAPLTAEHKNAASGATSMSPGGTVYVVSVSGPKMYRLNRQPYMRRAAEGVQLYQLVTIDGDTLRYEAHLATGELYDAFTLHKRPNEPNELIDQVPDSAERRQTAR